MTLQNLEGFISYSNNILAKINPLSTDLAKIIPPRGGYNIRVCMANSFEIGGNYGDIPNSPTSVTSEIEPIPELKEFYYINTSREDIKRGYDDSIMELTEHALTIGDVMLDSEDSIRRSLQTTGYTIPNIYEQSR